MKYHHGICQSNIQLLYKLFSFVIEPFYKLINEPNPDLKFIFEKVTTDINFLDINIKIVDNRYILIFIISQPILLVT